MFDYTDKAELEKELERELEQYRRMGEDEGTFIDEDFDIQHSDDHSESEYDLHRDVRPRSRMPEATDFESVADLDRTYTDSDLEALRAIKERIAPVKDHKAERERIDQEDVFTLTHSLDFAEQ